MSEPASFLELLRIITDYFHQRNVRYVVVGGVAVSVYGYPRSTQDIDLIIDHEELDVKDFCEYLGKNHFQVTRDELLAAFGEKSHVTIFHQTLSTRLDLKGNFSIEDEDTLRTALELPIENFKITLVSPEAFINHKLKFGSPRDLEDALAVYIRMKPKIQTQELHRIAKLTKVESLLSELIEIAEKSIEQQKKWMDDQLTRD
ncbi:MAG: DUF6036 family nucleotidyltransferase [Promethearchaeota archaeon]